MKNKRVEIEENFPRDDEEESAANESKEARLGRKRRADDSGDNDLVQELHLAQAKKKQKTGDRSKNDFRQKPLGFHLEKDLLVLGCIEEIKDFEAKVTLPDGLKGRLAITDICGAYTERLQRLAAGDGTLVSDGSEESGGKLLSLHNIFLPGSVVRCRVTEVDAPMGRKPVIKVSVDPKLVNRDLAQVEDKMTITGAICSIEDHGYEVDVGVEDKKTFLAKTEVSGFLTANANFPDNIDLSIGSYLTCLIKMKRQEKKAISRVVSLTIDPKKVGSAVRTDAVLQSLLPGTVVSCTVDSKLEKGILVQFGSGNTGIIFNGCLETGQDRYEIDQELTATVLYIQPSTKVAVLSQLGHLRNPALYENPFASMETGRLTEGSVIKVVPKVGVYLKLEGNLKGLVKKNHLADDRTDTKDFKKGENHKCRVIGHDHISRLVLLTMKESLLKMAYFNYHDVKLGQVISCTVKRLNHAGAVVKVTGRVSGLVPLLHLSDVPLTQPERMFCEGREIKCRVLSVDVEEQRMVLTHKRSLVKPKNLLPYSYEEVEPGSLLTGFAVLVKPTGLLVAFGGEVKGWVPKKELSHEIIDHPEKSFFLGQVLECRVKFVKPEEKKIVLSLKITRGEGEGVGDGEARGRKVKRAETEGVEKKQRPVQVEEVAEVEEVDAAPEVKVEVKGSPEKKKEPELKTLELPCRFDWEKMDVDEVVQPISELDKGIPRSVKAVRTNKRRMELEKATLLEPNSSKIWIELIGFEAGEGGDVEMARELAERALKTISYREEEERLNVHLCRLNLEKEFGSPDSFRQYYSRCLASCDQFRVMAHVRNLHADAEEKDATEGVCKVMLKKFGEVPDAWIGCCSALYKCKLLEPARDLLKKAVKRLPEKYHVLVATKFALLESEYGLPAAADNIFEGVLKNFPRRTDVWSVYADRCAKLGRYDQARNVLRRAVGLDPPLPPKKAAFLLRKFVAFELAHGGSPLVVDELKARLAKVAGEGEGENGDGGTGDGC